MAAPVVVPDASVILKWVLPSSADESDVVPALALRDAVVAGEIRALAPELWIYEVGNTLARRFPDRAERLIDGLLRFDLPSAPRSRGWLAHALALTQRYGVTFYDAAYHAHAIMEEGTFVTADERYVAKAERAGFVARLSDWA